MANPQHLRFLKRGTRNWNEWRKAHPFERPDLEGAKIRRINLQGVNLDGADLRNAKISGASLVNATLKGADLRGAYVAQAKLRQADLRGTELSGASFRDTDLANADLSGSKASETDFSGAKMVSCRLVHADWRKARLRGADLTKATLTEAQFDGVDFKNSILNSSAIDRCDFTNSIFGGTIFAAMDLSTAIALHKTLHNSPSQISTDSILLSRRNVPEEFFKAAGMPKEVIDSIPSLLLRDKPILYHNAFISYAHEDREFVSRLHGHLEAAGVKCWLDDHKIKIGQPLQKSVDEAIINSERLILILSRWSINSPWVEREVELALSRERRGRRTILVPLMIDSALKTTEKSWLRSIYDTRRVGDMRSWRKWQIYLSEFSKVLNALGDGEK